MSDISTGDYVRVLHCIGTHGCIAWQKPFVGKVFKVAGTEVHRRKTYHRFDEAPKGLFSPEQLQLVEKCKDCGCIFEPGSACDNCSARKT